MDQLVTKETRCFFVSMRIWLGSISGFQRVICKNRALLVKTYTLPDPEKSNALKNNKYPGQRIESRQNQSQRFGSKNKRVAFVKSLTNQKSAFGHLGIAFL